MISRSNALNRHPLHRATSFASAIDALADRQNVASNCTGSPAYRYVTEGSFDAYMWVRRESCSFDCVACRKTMTTPAVPSAVAYRHVRVSNGRVRSCRDNVTRPVGSRAAPQGTLCPASTKAGEVPGLVV